MLKKINYFSQNLRFLRKKMGLKQSEMQDYIGFARTTWSSYENGAAQPDIDGILKIASFFGVSVSELLEDNLGELAAPAFHTKATRRGPAAVPGDGDRPDQDLPAWIKDLVLSEIVRSKQQVIETQAKTIQALQALVDRMAANENEKRMDGTG